MSQALNLFTSTADVYARQKKQLEQEAEKKKLLIEQLETFSKNVAFKAGEINQQTLNLQKLVITPPTKTLTSTASTSAEYQDPLEQMNGLLTLLETVKKGEMLAKLDEKISLLNKQVGATQALSEELLEEAKSLEGVIKKFEDAILAKEQKLKLAKEVSQAASQL